jgi:putative membrane protein
MTMQFFYWLVLLTAVGVAIFAIQNSAVPLITVKFFLWKFETSLIYIILGSIAVGILITLFLWVPRGIKILAQSKELKKKIENLEKMLYGPSPSLVKGDTPKET